jgi:hydroxymethylglutaryl-CoA lyase
MLTIDRVWLTDVCPRDGFQIEPRLVSTETKVKTINALSAAGVSAIEVTSFVHPKAVPQMADAEEVMSCLTRFAGTRYEVLVPNLRGAERALRAKPDQLNLVVSASDSHNRANLRRGTFETMDEFREVARIAADAGLPLRGGIATSFGCPFEGVVPLSRLMQVVDRYQEVGVESITLADTTGMANPKQIRNIIRELKNRWNHLKIHVHFHNTRGMGLANVYAAYLEGVRHFDAALGGIGGCPFAPGATGNICSEDTVNMFHDMGIETGVDLDCLLSASRQLEQDLGHGLPSQVLKAGKTLDLHPIR